MHAIGIDIGTTSICGVVVDIKTGEVLKSITKDSNAFIYGTADWEKTQSPEKIIAIATEVLESLLSDQVAVIGVTGQMHGIVYVDGEGKAVSPLYTWQDGRGNQPYEGTTYAEYLGSCSGYGCVTDFYNRKNGLVPKEAAAFCTIHDYFVMTVCGLKKPNIHITDAASFGLFDLQSKQFTCENGVPFTEGYKIAGYYQNIPVGMAIGDNQASVLTSPTGEKELLINIGTGSQVSVLCDQIKTCENVETRPFFEGKYLVVGSALCGGRAYAMLKEFYKTVLVAKVPIEDGEVYGLMDRFLETADCMGLCVDTRFAGTRADETIRGSIQNISVDNFTPAALTKGVLEGMIRELHDMYVAMDVPVSSMVGSGNGIRKNKALVRAAEEMFGCPIRIPACTEEAAFGAALYGMLAAGHYSSMREAAYTFSAKT